MDVLGSRSLQVDDDLQGTKYRYRAVLPYPVLLLLKLYAYTVWYLTHRVRNQVSNHTQSHPVCRPKKVLPLASFSAPPSRHHPGSWWLHRCHWPSIWQSWACNLRLAHSFRHSAASSANINAWLILPYSIVLKSTQLCSMYGALRTGIRIETREYTVWGSWQIISKDYRAYHSENLLRNSY